ncbi:MAG: hypothetical protein SPF03_01525 [Faecalimonas umbilicata]|uniref:hypothetical protein n=1 Tax=Faecalimonas umbilicata TaxID=1912855 RepID=UPI00242C25CA|nr:hypothetical protein [Faecalimonas umbilicata]MCI5986953.1 hypothetical protein [Faecalimonas umbilicata]MDY5092189.1 hypothetical protein [Faecalimonas umbilicata]
MKNEKMLLRELGNKLSFVLPKRQERSLRCKVRCSFLTPNGGNAGHRPACYEKEKVLSI